MSKKRRKPANVAAKTKRLICSKLGHDYPRTDRPFKRCQRCGTPVS